MTTTAVVVICITLIVVAVSVHDALQAIARQVSRLAATQEVRNHLQEDQQAAQRKSWAEANAHLHRAHSGPGEVRSFRPRPVPPEEGPTA